MHVRTISRAFFLALSVGAPAFAGVTLTMKQENTKKDTVIYLEGNKMRVDTEKLGPQQSASFIFDGDSQKMISLNPETKTYTEMTADDMKAMHSQAQNRMKESLAKMTPEQRKQMDQMMSKMDPQQRKQMEEMMAGKELSSNDSKAKADEDKVKWENTGTKEKVAGFTCNQFKELRSGKPDAVGCYIPWSSAAVTKEDLAPMMKMTELMTGAGLGRQNNPFAQFSKLPGFPGKWAHLSADGKAEDPQVVTGIKRGNVANDLFLPPKGYSKAEKPSFPKN